MATAEEKEGEATADAAASKMVSTETDAVVPEALAPPAVAAAKDHDGDDDNENDGADDADDNLSADLFGEDADDDDDGADAAPAPPDKAEEEADGNAAISSSSNQQDATTNTTTPSSSLLSPSSEAATSAIGSPTTASSGSETFSIPKKQHSNANANANAKILSSPSEDLPPGVPTAASIALPVGAQQHQHQQKAPARKDSSASAGSASSSTGGAGQGNANGGKLPEGITVPESAKDLLNPRITGMLEQLPVDQMNAALQEYDEAVQQRKPIRNHPGYLSGVIRRYITLQQRITRASNEDNADESSIRPMGDHLTQAVKDAIQKKLLSTGFCTELDLDDKVGSKLKQLPERDALLAIDEISTVNRGSIRNFGSYFMGILNRYMRGERDGGHGGGYRHGGQRGSDRGGDDRGGGRPHYGRDDRRQYHHDHRDGGRTDFDRRRRDDSLDRYGDRDRGDRYGSGGRGESRSRYRRDRSPDDRYGRGGDRDRYGDSGRRSRYRSRSRSRSRSPSPYGRERKYSRDDGHGPSKRQSRWGASSPPSRPTASAPIAQGGLSQYGSFAGSAVPPPPPPRTQPPVGTRVFPRSNVLPPNAYHAAPVPAPAMYGSVAAPAPGVYGASTVPVMVPGAANPYGPPAAASVPSAIPAHYGQVPPPLPPPVAAAPAAVPGLDLASLASQAQQALSSIHGIPPAAPAAMQKPQYTKPPMASDVTEADLPMMVQYSLKNLKTTGHIDGMLDPGICRMLQGLPETTALEALQKFQSCDTSSMRNKNAYLGGIIKRKREEAAGGGR